VKAKELRELARKLAFNRNTEAASSPSPQARAGSVSTRDHVVDLSVDDDLDHWQHSDCDHDHCNGDHGNPTKRARSLSRTFETDGNCDSRQDSEHERNDYHGPEPSDYPDCYRASGIVLDGVTYNSTKIVVLPQAPKTKKSKSTKVLVNVTLQLARDMKQITARTNDLIENGRTGDPSQMLNSEDRGVRFFCVAMYSEASPCGRIEAVEKCLQAGYDNLYQANSLADQMDREVRRILIGIVAVHNPLIDSYFFMYSKGGSANLEDGRFVFEENFPSLPEDDSQYLNIWEQDDGTVSLTIRPFIIGRSLLLKMIVTNLNVNVNNRLI
jgi:hypothetical protein